MSAFKIGDRVVITKNYRGAGCNHDMIGYYGHVVRLPFKTNDDESPFFAVNLIGRTNGEPISPHRVGHLECFPIYEFEMEHAD